MAWNRWEAERLIAPVLGATGLFLRAGSGCTGVVLLPHKNTFHRKRESARLVRFEYWIKRKQILLHCEPWVNFPSDELVTKMMLLPREVREESNV